MNTPHGEPDPRSTPSAQIPADTDEFERIQQLLVEAAEHAHVGEEIPKGARMRPLKQKLVKALRPVTSFQRVYNNKVLLALTRLKDHFEAVTTSEYSTMAQFDRLNVSISTLDVALDQVNDRVRELAARTDDLENAKVIRGELDEQIATVAQLRERLQLLEAKQNVIFREARAGLGEDADIESMRTLATELDGDDARLYADMEDLFRGSRDQVRSLMEPYLADIAEVPSHAPIVDIGCGRGEWLELLRDDDLEAYGLDLNPVTVDECVARGLDVRLEDAVKHLRGLGESSLRAVTGFHIAEHLPLDALLTVIESARYALVPGGMLVLETPNCTNLSVGASSFYLDPTHVKPLHPQLMEFLCHHRGFTDVEIRYLHRRRPEIAADSDDRHPDVLGEINWALFGPMDYAVIAKRGQDF